MNLRNLSNLRIILLWIPPPPINCSPVSQWSSGGTLSARNYEVRTEFCGAVSGIEPSAFLTPSSNSTRVGRRCIQPTCPSGRTKTAIPHAAPQIRHRGSNAMYASWVLGAFGGTSKTTLRSLMFSKWRFIRFGSQPGRRPSSNNNRTGCGPAKSRSRIRFSSGVISSPSGARRPTQ
jgi:hypothetical protein